jgi:ParB family chromosome partitioning protein
MSGYHNNSIFWIETEKIQPNPYQPRRDFEPKALEDLADSLRQYGVLQPLVVTRKEIPMENGQGMSVSYELIAGERRLRASKIAGIQQVPVIIRKETDDKIKLELAIIENLQREDLNPIDRALAFEQLYKDFNLTHAEIGKKMGKSRVYVSNSLRLLSLPEEMRQGLVQGRITEGHTRPLLMLSDRIDEQMTLYREIMLKKMSVRDSEMVARKIAQDRVRKKEFIIDPKIRDYERRLSENLGTRVHIEPKEKGGKITIDYFTLKDLDSIIGALKKTEEKNTHRMMDQYLYNEKQDVNFEKVSTLSATTLMDSTPLELHEHSVDTQQASVFHQQLPEFHHNPDHELQTYKQEIESPKTPREPMYNGYTDYNEPSDHNLDIHIPTHPLHDVIADDTEIFNDIPPKQNIYNHTVSDYNSFDAHSLGMIDKQTGAPLQGENTFGASELSSFTGQQEIPNNDHYFDTAKTLQDTSFQNTYSATSTPMGDRYDTPVSHAYPESTPAPQHISVSEPLTSYTTYDDRGPDVHVSTPDIVQTSYTGEYHNPQAAEYQPKKKGFFGNLFK